MFFLCFSLLFREHFQSRRLNQSRSSGDPWRAPEFLLGASGDHRGLIPEPPLLRVCVSVGAPRLSHLTTVTRLGPAFLLDGCRHVCDDITMRKHFHVVALIWPLTFPLCHPDSKLVRWWRRVLLLSDGSSGPSKETWVGGGGGSLEQVFQVHVDSHTPPPRRRNNIQRHTQQTGWRSPCLQPFLGTPLPSAPPFLVWGLLKRGGAHGRSVISVHAGSACVYLRAALEA